MPARRVFAWEPEEQWTSSEEREKKIEELSRELDESMDSNSGKGCLKAYLVKNEVWHIADIDYELRVDYRKYLMNSCFIISGNTGTSCKNRNTCLLTSKGIP